MTNIKRFHPGVYIKDSMDAMKVTVKDLSAGTGISEHMLSSIIDGRECITLDIAGRLSSYFDNSTNYWIDLRSQYDAYLLEKNNG